MKSSKRAAAKNTSMIGRLYTLHERLYHAFNLGNRFYDGKKWKWQWTSIEAQKCVVRSIASFLNHISEDTINHHLVKDSIADIVGALAWILSYKSEAVTRLAAIDVLKLINIIPNAILQSHILDLVHPLSSFLSSQQFEVSMSCATALNMILLKLSMKNEKKVWEIMTETKTIFEIVSGIRELFTGGNMSIEHFQVMASLLSTILHRWPASRYPVWSDAKVMEILEVMCVKPDLSVKAAVLKLYSGLALCGNGARRLLDGGEAFIQETVLCMSRSCPLPIRMEAMKLAQRLMSNEQGCLKMTSLLCEPIVEAIIDGISGWTLQSGKIASDQLSLLVEACRLALIVQWGGEHHNYFWRHGVDKVLLNLILEDYSDVSSHHFMSLEEQTSKVQEGLMANFLITVRSYVWDILGWLAAHCRDDFNPTMDGHEHIIHILITCACLSFADSIRKGGQIYQLDVAYASRSESVSRAVLMMIYSPCKYISSKVISILPGILQSMGKDKEYLKYLLRSLNVASSYKDTTGIPNNVLQFIVNLVALTCCTGLPQFQSCISESGGIDILIQFVKWCLSSNVHIGRQSFTSHLHTKFSERTCCWERNEWEGDNILLFYGFWGLAELLNSGRVDTGVFADMMDGSETQFISILQEICRGASAPGLKWYAAYLLCFFGFYGFPCKFGRRMGVALDDIEYADRQLILANEESVSIHGILLATRCSALLPPEDLDAVEKVPDGSSVRHDATKQSEKSLKEIRLSPHVDGHALKKLMEYVYSGYLCSGQELVKKLRVLAKHCGLQHLCTLLCRRRPKWGTAFPTYDLSDALGPIGHCFSDIILEAKTTESISWTCCACSLSTPHIHAHKIVLKSSSDYFSAMFRSGMHESHAQTIKVPVSWEAMAKLVNWFYTNELPAPPLGCLWDNMDNEERLRLLLPYVELYWLSELWLLKDIEDFCYEVIVSCLDSARHLSIKIIKICFDLSLWRLAEVSASYLAPLYHQLSLSGDLETLDETLVDMIRAASVHLSQKEFSAI